MLEDFRQLANEESVNEKNDLIVDLLIPGAYSSYHIPPLYGIGPFRPQYPPLPQPRVAFVGLRSLSVDQGLVSSVPSQAAFGL